MDPYSGAAYIQIWLFLADLNLVLRPSLFASPYGLLGTPQLSFNHVGLPPQSNCSVFQQSPLNCGVFQQSLPWNQSTKQSRAWKMHAKESQSARRPPYIASRKEYVPHRPKSCVPHQSTSQPNNLRLDHHKPKNGFQTTFTALPDCDNCLRNCQQNNDPNQSPSEAPENKDVASENKNEMKILNNSTKCPASAVDTVEDPKKLIERISDAIDCEDRSNLIIDLGPEAGDPISFHPVTAPAMSPAVSCSQGSHTAIGMSPPAQNPGQNYHD
jgi:hypothetical protein